MQLAHKEEAKEFKNSDSCIAYEYPIKDPDINAAVIKLSGRYPDKGRTVNTECKELVYVIEGSGKLVVEGSEFDLRQGDALLIDKGERFYWEGNMTLFMPCTPAWSPEQHKEVD